MNEFLKITKSRNLYEDVIKAIKEVILSGAYPSGTLLPSEAELSRQFEVSRPVIREALRGLQSTGFIDIKRGTKGGIVVRDISRLPLFDDFESFIRHRRFTVDHLARVRLYMEPEICRLAAINATPADILEMKTQVATYADVPSVEKDEMYSDFHRLVGRACGNPIYSLLMENIMDFTIGFIHTLRPVTAIIHNDDDHDEYIAAIEDKDPARAADVAIRHSMHISNEMTRLEKTYLALLEKNNPH